MRIARSCVGNIIYHLAPVRRSLIRANLLRVFGGHLDHKESTRLTKAFYAHMFQFLVECVRSSKERVVVQHLDRAERALEVNKGALWVTCHLGNWEVAFVKFMEQNPQFRNRLSLIRKRLRPAWLHRLVMRRFQYVGIEILDKSPASIRAILKKLANNEVVLFVQDQHVSRGHAITAKFFGYRVQFARSLARIALHTGAPVVPVVTWRDKAGHHVCHFGEPVPVIPSSVHEEAIRATTQSCNVALERFVLQHPEQWFCLSHHLWKPDRKLSSDL